MSGDDKQSAYRKEQKTDGFQDLADRLTDDMLKVVKNIGMYDILSDDWCDHATQFGRLANASTVESTLADPKDGSTLWETEEQALRFMVEEGKVNTLIRELKEFKEYERTHNFFQDIPDDEKENVHMYEVGAGTILLNAWKHLEVIQTTDLVLLLEHITLTLKMALEHTRDTITPGLTKGDLHQKQEIVCLHFLRVLLLGLVDMSEDRVMPAVRGGGVLQNGLKVLAMCHNRIPRTALLPCLHALSLDAETEDFSTHKAQYLAATEEDLMLYTKLQADCLAGLLEDLEVRKEVRGVNSAIDQAKRMGVKSHK